MRKILSIAHYTFVENTRNKIFYVLVLFGVVIVAASSLIGAISGEQNTRVLLDFGLGSIEFFALISISFSAVTLILEEMEQKTIYLVLTRPVSRSSYLIGRFTGLLAAVLCGMALMAIVHLGVLFLNGWKFTPRYILGLCLSGEKIMVIGSLALFFSLFSTSAVSSISFTVFFWILGHFSQEINFISNRTKDVIPKVLGKIIYYLIPNLQYFNLRDFWDVPGILGSWIVISIGYGLIYSLFFLVLSLWFFKYKEF
ncbi:MAG: ABC transporter permease subunit [Elusimicrobia bacterium]|nr:ABC transporter permease subunit [Elusimicrobiota bacterium]